MEIFDISNFSYSQWLDFTFGQNLQESLDTLIISEIKSNHSKVLVYMTDLFQNMDVVIAKYDMYQVDAGLNFISGIDGYHRYLYDPKVHSDVKISCIQAMPALFHDLFSTKNTDYLTSPYMWWDNLFSYCSYLDNEKKDFGLWEDPCILSEFYNVIIEQLSSSVKEIQACGKEGLFHYNEFMEAMQHMRQKHRQQ